MNWPWSELDLPGPAGLSEVRRAYAERLNTTHPEGFQRLHEAYQQARRLARKGGGGSSDQKQTPPEPRERENPRAESGWDYDELVKPKEEGGG